MIYSSHVVLMFQIVPEEWMMVDALLSLLFDA